MKKIIQKIKKFKNAYQKMDDIIDTYIFGDSSLIKTKTDLIKSIRDAIGKDWKSISNIHIRAGSGKDSGIFKSHQYTILVTRGIGEKNAKS